MSKLLALGSVSLSTRTTTGVRLNNDSNGIPVTCIYKNAAGDEIDVPAFNGTGGSIKSAGTLCSAFVPQAGYSFVGVQ